MKQKKTKKLNPNLLKHVEQKAEACAKDFFTRHPRYRDKKHLKKDIKELLLEVLNERSEEGAVISKQLNQVMKLTSQALMDFGFRSLEKQ